MLEFWPEYNSGPLWTAEGASVDLESLPLEAELGARLRSWNARYDDSKLPFQENDEIWLAEGKLLLEELRATLGEGFSILVTEPWWGEEPST